MVSRISAALIVAAGPLGAALFCQPAGAVDLVVDYSYDTYDFFGEGNPDGAAAGAAAKASLEEAARYLSEVLEDSFGEISTPAPFTNSGAVYTWDWNITFNHPSTNAPISIENPTIAVDEYRIYAGARPISGSTLGVGGPGGLGYSSGGSYYPSDLPAIQAITDEFASAIEDRGQPGGGFAHWGGVITFDTGTDWHWDWTTSPGGGNDFYSVAIHELAHALGFGTSDEWNALSRGGVFLGEESYTAYGNAYPPTNGGHWDYGVQSTVLGMTDPQETAFDPSLTTGTRKYHTALDAAGLADIGWEINPAAPWEVVLLDGDFNDDGAVDAADYTVWRDNLGAPAGTLPNDPSGMTVGASQYALWRINYGATASTLRGWAAPEPAAALLALAAATAVGVRRRATR